MSTELLGTPSPSKLARMRRRALQARVALARAQGYTLPVALPGDTSDASIALLAANLAAVSHRLGRHGLLLCLIALVLVSEAAWTLSKRAATPSAPPLAPWASAPGERSMLTFSAPPAIGPIGLGGSVEQLAPVFSQPVEVPTAFQAYHPLRADETLGELARRYGVSLETLVWANSLEQGDAIAVGQVLRIPHTSGLTYIVAEREDARDIALRFGVPVEAIAGLPSNGVSPQLALIPGTEIFIPGANKELPAAWLAASGGLEGLGLRRAGAVGVVRLAETNLRTGPSTDHPPLAQLEAGRRVALRARNGDWLNVELGALRGWMRADMLAVPSEQIDLLPVSNDFPPPPPRWVWPARGALTSGFGPRWRRFHNGIDIANRAWTPIVAARTGVVKEAGWCSGYGYCVKLSHDGGVETIYGHLITKPVVVRGEQVSVGELIGNMGSTYDRAGGGYSTGVHLHFTVLVNGKAVNPLRFLP